MKNINDLMNLIKDLTVEELVEFSKEFDAYRKDIIEALGGNVMSNNNSTKETKSATKETKEKSRHANNSKTQMTTIDKEAAFAEGYKAGDKVEEEDTILTCAKTNNNTVVGGQCIINNTVCNYSYYVQFGKAVVYSNDVTKDQLEELEENIYDEIPSGVRIFDAVPSNHPDSPTHNSRWYYDELKKGNFIFSNPDGSYMGYTNEYAFVIRESGFMETIKMNYVFGKAWRKPSEELKANILALKTRAFGNNTNEPTKEPKKESTKESKKESGVKSIKSHNRNIPFNTTPQQKKDKKPPTKLPEDKISEAAKMQRLDLSMLIDDFE